MASDRDQALQAYERGDADALARLQAALVQHPHDGGLLIAQARALAGIGAPNAGDRLRAMLRSAPDWLDGHVAYAQLAWDRGEAGTFLAELEAALERMPRHAGLWMRYMNLLAGSGAPARAADVARDLRRQGDAPALRLIEAHHAGMAGDFERAGALLDEVPDAVPEKALEAGRHRLRLRDPAGAAALLEPARVHNLAGVSAWALTELAWRASGDARHDWLLAGGQLVAPLELALDPAELAALADVLRALHRTHARPLGQSAREGTQTAGNVWRRREPEIGALRARLDAAVAAFVAGLPPSDASHPLLRHRDGQLAITTGWSIRLRASGHHISHIHSEGLLSSACYIAVPADAGGREGWLELGTPPADIPIDLPPLTSIAPSPGRLVLFPSFLYHGTRPFQEGERLSVAFDVAPVAV